MKQGVKVKYIPELGYMYPGQKLVKYEAAIDAVVVYKKLQDGMVEVRVK
jgi:hypothetical protein